MCKLRESWILSQLPRVFLIKKTQPTTHCHSITLQKKKKNTKRHQLSQPETKSIFTKVLKSKPYSHTPLRKTEISGLAYRKTVRLLISADLYRFPVTASLRGWDRERRPQPRARSRLWPNSPASADAVYEFRDSGKRYQTCSDQPEPAGGFLGISKLSWSTVTRGITLVIRI